VSSRTEHTVVRHEVAVSAVVDGREVAMNPDP